MKIKVPIKLKIASHEYTIKDDEQALKSASTVGEARHIYHDILIDFNRVSSEVTQTFLHEYLHCIERFWNVKIDDNDVDRLAEGVAVLFNNLNIEFDWSDIKDGGRNE